MLLNAFSVFSLFFAFACMFLAYKLLASFRWFLAWLKGTVGLLALGAAVFLCFVHVDLLRYAPFENKQKLYTVMVEKVGEQHYALSLNSQQSGLVSYLDQRIKGDSWAMSYDTILWGGQLPKFGAQGGYRFTGLSGRFYSLEQARLQGEGQIPFKQAQALFDFHHFLNQSRLFTKVAAGNTEKTQYLPLSDNAIFSVYSGRNGLYIEPDS